MDDSLLTPIRISLWIAACATVTASVVGAAIGYLLSRRPFPGRRVVEALLLLPMILPPSVVGFYLLVLLGRHGFIGHISIFLTGESLLFSQTGAVIAATTVSLPLMIRVAQATFASVDPVHLETAYTLGYSEHETFFRVVLPLSKRSLLAGIILVFARCMGEFGATLMVAGNIPGRTATMPLAIYSLAVGGDWAAANRLVLLLTALSVFVLVAVRLFDRKAL